MRIKLILISLLLASCSGIGKLPSFISHKMDVQQGNLISPEMRDKLKIGMTKTQARAIMGTPLINDVFHANRWDYVYRMEQNSELIEQQHMTLYFDGEILARIDDSRMPLVVAVDSSVASAPAVSVPVVTPVPDIVSVVEEPVIEKPAPAVEQAEVAPVAEPVATATISPAQQVIDRVKNWAVAWSAQDIAKYLAHYSVNFKPVNNVSHAAWESQRRERVSRPSSIKVEVSDIQVSMQGEKHASAEFDQYYQADYIQGSMRKVLELEEIDGKWLIIGERAARN